MKQIILLHKNLEGTVEDKNRHSKYLQKNNNIISGTTIKIKKFTYMTVKIKI